MVKITIITPSFNQALFLEQTIDSVLSQNYRNLEYMVVDGGSKDGSLEIIKRYEKYLSYWVSEPDHGQSHAINKGLKRATGEIINWLNSDDYLEPHALNKIQDHFCDPKTLAVLGRSNIVLEGKVLRQSNGTDIYHGNLAKTIGLARIDQPETYFRKSAIDQVGLLNEHLHYVMDKEWWIRFLLIHGLQGIKKVDDVFVNFRLHPQSKTVSSANNFINDGLLVVQRMSELADLKEATNQLRQLTKSQASHVMIPADADLLLMRQSLMYTFYYIADYYYYHHNNYNLAHRFLNLVDSRILSRADERNFKRLRLKLKIPYFIRRFFQLVKGI